MLKQWEIFQQELLGCEIMNIIRKIGKWLSGDNIRGKSSASDFKQWITTSGGISGALPTDKELEDAYHSSSIVAACVKEIVDAVSAFDLVVEGAPYIEALLKHPSPRTDWKQFISDFTRRYLVCGGSFIWKRRTNGVLSQLMSVPTSAVHWRRSDDKFALTLYDTMSRRSQHKVLDWKDLPGLMIKHISSTYRWSSMLSAVWSEIQLDIQKSSSQHTILENLADASLVIESEQPSSMEQRKELRESVRQVTAGSHKGGILVLPPGFKANAPGKMRDISLGGISRMCESRISSCLNVPAVLVGLEVGLEHMTYSNYFEARDSFYTETIVPLTGLIGGFLTRVLLEDEGISGKIRLEQHEEPTVAPPVNERIEEDANSKTQNE